MTGFWTLTWLSARQLRGVALLTLTLIAAYAVVVAGPRRLADLYQSMAAFASPMYVLPILFGAGVAAPLLAREQQRGTVDLAYTQSMPRGWWLTARILPTLGLAVLATLGVRAAFSVPPGNYLNAESGLSSLPGALAAVLFTCALGLCAGAVLGRVLPAVAVTVTGFLLTWTTGLRPLVELFAPFPDGPSYYREEFERVGRVFVVVLLVLAGILLAATVGWMTRRVPRS